MKSENFGLCFDSKVPKTRIERSNEKEEEDSCTLQMIKRNAHSQRHTQAKQMDRTQIHSM